MIVDVRMGDSGMIRGSSRLIGELTDTALRGGISSDVDRGERTRFPSNLTQGDSIGDKCDNWDGDIGASSGPSTFVRLFIFLTLRLTRRT